MTVDLTTGPTAEVPKIFLSTDTVLVMMVSSLSTSAIYREERTMNDSNRNGAQQRMLT